MGHRNPWPGNAHQLEETLPRYKHTEGVNRKTNQRLNLKQMNTMGKLTNCKIELETGPGSENTQGCHDKSLGCTHGAHRALKEFVTLPFGAFM